MRIFLVILLSFFYAVFHCAVSAAAQDALSDAVREAVRKVSPRLVRIDTIGGYDSVGSGEQKELVNEGATTGVILDPQGHIITSSFNFLHDPSSILVRLPDGTLKVAKKIANDSNRMLTLLKIDVQGQPLKLEPFDGTKIKVRVGQYSIAVGRALSVEEANISLGIISGEYRIWGKAIQTDAKVSPGNYGGPLIDIQGRVLGILVPLSAMSDAVAGGAEMYDAGVGLAIPLHDVLESFGRLKSGQNLQSGYLGLGFKELATFTGPPILDNVIDNGPAWQAGIRKGDRVVKINDEPIDTAMQATMQLRIRYAGDKLRLHLQRTAKEPQENKEFFAEIKLLTADEMKKIVKENSEKDTELQEKNKP